MSAPRMSDKDFQERRPGRNDDSSPDSSGLAVWEEAQRARESETELLGALRDQFAGMAMVAFLRHDLRRGEERGEELRMESVAFDSYTMADTMLRVRGDE